ncbi:YciI family protein [Breoghania sp.]|uniref:YciI family protein n=1 Tax=Breoghania sp. TaxID=2065378 RepID=UPI002AA724B7|nr:YciI family protein [Breoghania sp.]
MFFLMECTHHHDKDADRDQLRPEHRAWVASGGEGLARVLVGSAIWHEDGTARGHFGILEAARETDARAFAEGDPFATGGIVRDIRLLRLADGFQAHRIDPMTK